MKIVIELLRTNISFLINFLHGFCDCFVNLITRFCKLLHTIGVILVCFLRACLGEKFAELPFTFLFLVLFSDLITTAIQNKKAGILLSLGVAGGKILV